MNTADYDKRFCDLQQHVTLAILPNAGPVTAIADRARKNGHDLLIHLPMEPDDYPAQDPGNGAIMAHYSEGEVRSVLQRALKRIPHAVGFNNHMGSKITRDERIMRTLLAEAKSDSYSSKTAARRRTRSPMIWPNRWACPACSATSLSTR